MLPGPPTVYHSLLTVEDKGKLATLRAGVTGAADIGGTGRNDTRPQVERPRRLLRQRP